MCADGYLLLYLNLYEGIREICPKTNKSELILEQSSDQAENFIQGFTWAGFDNKGKPYFVGYSSAHKLVILHRNYSANGHPLQPTSTIDIDRWICPLTELVRFPTDIAVDSITGIVYITYQNCGQIRAYDLKSTLFATVYEDLEGETGLIVTAPSAGYEFLSHSVVLKEGHTSSKASLCLDIFLVVPELSFGHKRNPSGAPGWTVLM